MADACRGCSVYHISGISLAARRSFHRPAQSGKKTEQANVRVMKTSSNPHSYWMCRRFYGIMILTKRQGNWVTHELGRSDPNTRKTHISTR